MSSLEQEKEKQLIAEAIQMEQGMNELQRIRNEVEQLTIKTQLLGGQIEHNQNRLRLLEARLQQHASILGALKCRQSSLCMLLPISCFTPPPFFCSSYISTTLVLTFCCQWSSRWSSGGYFFGDQKESGRIQNGMNTYFNLLNRRLTVLLNSQLFNMHSFYPFVYSREPLLYCNIWPFAFLPPT